MCGDIFIENAEGMGIDVAQQLSTSTWPCSRWTMLLQYIICLSLRIWMKLITLADNGEKNLEFIFLLETCIFSNI